MNRKEALARAREILTDSHIDDATLEGEILLRHMLGKSRARLYADLDSDVSPDDYKLLKKLVKRRVKGEPSAYIIGNKEFYGLNFIVNRHVLIPRPETELLVEKAIDICRNNRYFLIADIGTGCGAIAISLAVNLPSVKIYATDVSIKALEVAAQNCTKHGVTDRISFLRGDLLEPLPESIDLIIANLPYVKEAAIPAKGPLSFEPQLALNGGERGLDKIERLCRQEDAKLNSQGSLLIEIGQGQAEDVKTILHKYFPSGLIEVQKDLAGIERVVSLRLT
ncbi:MAG: peptide chain release factor N(5)-glutamine methyltransferase [Dehalococcoidales bacterium]